MKTSHPRDLILKKASQKFFSLGFTRVSMDEIAQELGMSKKTLYKHFPGKTRLLQEVTLQFVEAVIRDQNRVLQDKELDFERRFTELVRVLAESLARISLTFVNDVQRSAPEVWKTIEEARQKRIQLVFGRMLQEGQQKGFVRADLNLPFVIQLLSTLIREALNPDMVSQFSVSMVQAFDILRSIFLGGILTDVGRERFFTAICLPETKQSTWPP